MHLLSPNIYRTTSEALESFDYIAKHGKMVIFICLFLRRISFPPNIPAFCFVCYIVYLPDFIEDMHVRTLGLEWELELWLRDLQLWAEYDPFKPRRSITLISILYVISFIF